MILQTENLLRHQNFVQVAETNTENCDIRKDRTKNDQQKVTQYCNLHAPMRMIPFNDAVVRIGRDRFCNGYHLL
jgi:hypothetical protein